MNRVFTYFPRVATATVALTLIATATPFAAAQEEERYRAFAVRMGGIGPAGATTSFDIVITRWTTAEERDTLLTTLAEKGHDAFVEALRKREETGWVRGDGPLAAASDAPSTRVRYAWQFMNEGKRNITLVTNRPISNAEAAESLGRSMDFDVSMLTMQFPPKDGDKQPAGEGLLYGGLALGRDEKTGQVTVQVAGSAPLRLTNISPARR